MYAEFLQQCWVLGEDVAAQGREEEVSLQVDGRGRLRAQVSWLLTQGPSLSTMPPSSHPSPRLGSGPHR